MGFVVNIRIYGRESKSINRASPSVHLAWLVSLCGKESFWHIWLDRLCKSQPEGRTRGFKNLMGSSSSCSRPRSAHVWHRHCWTTKRQKQRQRHKKTWWADSSGAIYGRMCVCVCENAILIYTRVAYCKTALICANGPSIPFLKGIVHNFFSIVQISYFG